MSVSPYRTAGGTPRPPDQPRQYVAQAPPKHEEPPRFVKNLADVLSDIDDMVGVYEPYRPSIQQKLTDMLLRSPPFIWYRAIGAECEATTGW